MSLEREVCQLIIEQETIRHQTRAEAVFDCRRHRDHIAVLVGNDKMARGGQLERRIPAQKERVVPFRFAGLDGILGQRLVAIEQLCPFA